MSRIAANVLPGLCWRQTARNHVSEQANGRSSPSRRAQCRKDLYRGYFCQGQAGARRSALKRSIYPDKTNRRVAGLYHPDRARRSL